MELRLWIIMGSKRAEYTKEVGILENKLFPSSLRKIEEIV
jgi:hypothetical protein